MRTCNSCGGIIGRDCFNPMECETISYRMEQQEQQRVQAALGANIDDHYNLQYLFHLHHKLIEHLEAKGIDLSDYHKDLSQELPF